MARSSSNDWLVKISGEVIGPISIQEVVQHMFTGEIDESTPASTGDGEWFPIGKKHPFRPYLLQAKAKLRADQARAEAEVAERRRLRQLHINIVLACLAVLGVGFLVTYFFLVYKPWQNQGSIKAWSSKHLPLIGIPGALANQGEAEEEDSEEGRGIDIDQILIDDAPALVAIKSVSSPKRPIGTRPKPNGIDKPEPGVKATPPPKDVPEGGELAMGDTLSQEEILSVALSPPNKRKLFGCLKEEKKRNPGMPGKVTLDFAINNDGKVGEVTIEPYSLESGPLHQCFRTRLASFRFRSFAGQVRSIAIPFNLGD